MVKDEEQGTRLNHSVDTNAILHADSETQEQETRTKHNALSNSDELGEEDVQKGPHVEYESQAGSETDKKGSFFGSKPAPLNRRMSFHPHDSVFSPSKQAFQLLKGGLTRLVLTFILIAAMMGLLKAYASKNLLSTKDKRTFNALITGLSIALGLNVASAMKTLAGHLRWKSMSTNYMNPNEINLFLSIESVTTVCKLAIKEALNRPLVALACAVWVLISIAAQVGIAVIGLTYSVDTATDSLMFQPGSVTVTNFTVLNAGQGVNVSDPKIQRSLAQAAGQSALNSISWDTQDPPAKGSIFKGTSTVYDVYTDPQYVMIDYSSDYSKGVFTDRSITANATCRSYPVTSGANGDSKEVTYMKGDTPQNLTVGITAQAVTTFITSDQSCGSRCSMLEIFQSRDPEGDTNAATVFLCNLTLPQVANTTNNIEKIPDDIAIAATSAISGNNGFQSNETVQNSASYSSRLLVGLPTDNSPEEMQLFLKQYVIGLIATLDQTNEWATIDGMTPVTANSLSVEWKFIWIIMSLLAGGHAILLVLFTTFSSKVLIPHDNPLTIAKLLTPVVKAADEFKHQHGQGEAPKFVYSYREDEKDFMEAQFAQDLKPLSVWSRWPSDWYKKAHL